MARSRNILVKMNRRYPFVKVILFSGVILAVIVGVGISSVKGEQVMARLAEMGVKQSYDDSFKIKLGGETIEVSGVDEFESQVNKNIEQAEERDLTGKKLVALTFDDGPEVDSTREILETLKEKQVKATFFMLGIMVQRFPDVAKEVVSEGNEVETHSMRHANLSQMSWDEAVADLTEAKQITRDITGVEVEALRPPYGATNDMVKDVASMPMITWSVDPYDWRDRDAGLIKDRVVNASYDGAIILMHDIYPETAKALPWIIDELRERGFEFVTVKELAGKKGIELKNGEIYRDFTTS